MKIIIDKYRGVEKSGISGVKQENNVVTLNFEFPEEIQDFVKYIEFDIGKNKVFDLIENDMYTLTSAITQFEEVQAQIVAKKDEQVWKSKCFDLDFKRSINANHQIEDEEQIDVLNTVIQKVNLIENEIAELNEKIDNIQITGGGTSNYNDLENKPQINGIELEGNKTTKELGIEAGKEVHIGAEEPTDEEVIWIDPTEEADKIPTKVSELENDSEFVDEGYVNTAIQNALEVVENGTY